MSELLDLVAARAEELRRARREAEIRIRAQVEAELAQLSSALDFAAAQAYHGGEKKIHIGLAMNNKDYNTYNDAIMRGSKLIGDQPIHEPVKDAENAPLSGWGFDYASIDGNESILVNDGTFTAEFQVVEGETGVLFMSSTPLWSNDDVMNPLVKQLDMVDHGALYEAAVSFISESGE